MRKKGSCFFANANINNQIFENRKQQISLFLKQVSYSPFLIPCQGITHSILSVLEGSSFWCRMQKLGKQSGRDKDRSLIKIDPIGIGRSSNVVASKSVVVKNASLSSSMCTPRLFKKGRRFLGHDQLKITGHLTTWTRTTIYPFSRS